MYDSPQLLHFKTLDHFSLSPQAYICEVCIFFFLFCFVSFFKKNFFLEVITSISSLITLAKGRLSKWVIMVLCLGCFDTG